MRHHDTNDWIDYLRGLVGPDRQAAMEAHLREGCDACRDTVDRLAALARAVAEDEAFEPPPHVVRCARALFSQFRPERVRALPRLLARLVQDSLRDPVPAGIRGDESASRQFLYEANGIYLDLRLEQRRGQASVALVGQLLGREGPGEPIERRPIVLTSGREVVSMVGSNEHGEFHIEYVPAGQMRLHIPVEAGARRIEIGLNALLPRVGAGGSGRKGSRRESAARPRPIGKGRGQ